MLLPHSMQHTVPELEIRPPRRIEMESISFIFCQIANEKAAIIDTASEINDKWRGKKAKQQQFSHRRIKETDILKKHSLLFKTTP